MIEEAGSRFRAARRKPTRARFTPDPDAVRPLAEGEALNPGAALKPRLAVPIYGAENTSVPPPHACPVHHPRSG